MSFFFFFNDTATTEIYTLSLHDALPISPRSTRCLISSIPAGGHLSWATVRPAKTTLSSRSRSEEHTSELQSLAYLVCRLLLEKKKKTECSSRTVRRQRRTRPTAIRIRFT